MSATQNGQVEVMRTLLCRGAFVNLYRKVSVSVCVCVCVFVCLFVCMCLCLCVFVRARVSFG